MNNYRPIPLLYPDLSIHLAILHPVHHVHFIRSRPSDHARELSAVRNIQTYSAPSRNPAPPRDSMAELVLSLVLGSGRSEKRGGGGGGGNMFI